MENQNEINQQGNPNAKNDFRPNNRRGRGGFSQRSRGGRGMGRGRGYTNPVRRDQRGPRNQNRQGGNQRNQNRRGGFGGQSRGMRRNRRDYNVNRRDNNRVRNNL